jgi:hypothetical protein
MAGKWSAWDTRAQMHNIAEAMACRPISSSGRLHLAIGDHGPKYRVVYRT